MKKPKFLNNTPKGYRLDAGDKRLIASYKTKQAAKARRQNKVAGTQKRAALPD